MPTILGVTIIGLVFSLIFNPSRRAGGECVGLVRLVLGVLRRPVPGHAAGHRRLGLGGLGVAVVIYLAGLQAIPPELYEVASIDGASSWQRLRYVTIPAARARRSPPTRCCHCIGALQSYQLIYVLTGPINPATQVLSLAIFTQGFGGAQGGAAQSQGYAAAISMVQFVIVMIVSLATLVYLRRKETAL